MIYGITDTNGPRARNKYPSATHHCRMCAFNPPSTDIQRSFQNNSGSYFTYEVVLVIVSGHTYCKSNRHAIFG